MRTRTDSSAPWQDPSLPPARRAADLLARMDPLDKAGLLFHSNAMVGTIGEPDLELALPSLRHMVTQRRITHFSAAGVAPTGREFARWQNAAQRIAAQAALPVPITFSSDPRHGFAFNPATSFSSGQFSVWPEPLGIAAVGREELSERFGAAVREEYVAVGIRVALHPQLDIATEPRWSRIINTFGEDADTVTRLGLAYLRGLQDSPADAQVAGMIKHFPGGGPQLNGDDPHFAFGREQVYPGGRFDLHLEPFRAAIEQGVTQLMPYYGMPVGTEYEEVGFAFNHGVITGLLRDQLGYDGVVCSDWGILNDEVLFEQRMPARAWGVEHLTPVERAARALEAGIDQFGGEAAPGLILDAVRRGLTSQDRVDASALRVLTEKFRLGLFEHAIVDEDHAAATVGRADLVQQGLDAQREALTLLTNTASAAGPPTLPLHKRPRIYSEGVDRDVLARYAEPVDDPTTADVNIVRVKSPRTTTGLPFLDFFATGRLDYDEASYDALARTCRQAPTVLVVFVERPVVLAGLEELAAAVVADFGSSDEALLDVVFGHAEPRGRLPLDLPRSQAAVEASRADVPFDTQDPLFAAGFGLTYTPPPPPTTG